MLKALFITAAIILGALKSQADDVQKVSSKVNRVTVFLSGAQVTRQASVAVKAGLSTLVFEGLSPDIDPQSIQVKAGGEFTILSVKQELNYLNPVRQAKVDGLRNQQKVLQNKIDSQNDLLGIYQQEETMLEKNQVVSGQNVNLDVLKLKQALNFQTERLVLIKAKKQEINRQTAVLNQELQKLNAQIAEVNRNAKNEATSSVLVDISARQSSESLFTLNYVVKNAGWYPTYDIRARNVNSPINIAYKANVTQQSGEEWKSVKLTLSTGNPTVSGSKPELSPYYLNTNMSYLQLSENISKVSGTVIAADDSKPIQGVSILVKGTSIGTTTNAAGGYSLQVPAGRPTLQFRFIGYDTQDLPVTSSSMNVTLRPTANALNEVVASGYYSSLSGKVAGLSVNNGKSYSTASVSNVGYATEGIPLQVKPTENQTNIEFNIETPYTIPSDGKQAVVEINQRQLNAAYTYAVVPKLSTDVFLTAQLFNWSQYNFLPGEANLFFEDTYIGKSLLNTQTAGDTLTLSLGVDKNIQVTRTPQKELAAKQGLLGNNRKETRDWLITVKNRKTQAINLQVEDQVPVSQNTDIEVEVQETSGGKADAVTGKVTWQLNLKPDAEKKIELKYQVRYPRSKAVIVQ